jgi:Methyltransferase domain
LSEPAGGAPAPSCGWCGRPLSEPAESGVARCASCGAATTYPVPTDAELDRAYSDWYRPAEGRFSGPGDRLLSYTRGVLARRLDRIAPPGPILDVGSGDGALLRTLRARGREAVGLERSASGPGVRDADVREVEGEWAAVVFWHTLEHLREAGPALDHAAGLLAPRGVLGVAMPNLASLQARAFGDRWLALDLPRHLVHVPAPALLARLRERGLDVERVSHYRGGQVVFGWLDGLVGLLPGDLDLYGAIRREGARGTPIGGARRAGTLAAAAVLAPVATAAAATEVAARRGGSIYVEARRAVTAFAVHGPRLRAG